MTTDVEFGTADDPNTTPTSHPPARGPAMRAYCATLARFTSSVQSTEQLLRNDDAGTREDTEQREQTATTRLRGIDRAGAAATDGLAHCAAVRAGHGLPAAGHRPADGAVGGSAPGERLHPDAPYAGRLLGAEPGPGPIGSGAAARSPHGDAAVHSPLGGDTAVHHPPGSVARPPADGPAAYPPTGDPTVRPPITGDTAVHRPPGSVARPPATYPPSAGDAAMRPPYGGATGRPPTGGSTGRPPHDGSASAHLPIGGPAARPPHGSPPLADRPGTTGRPGAAVHPDTGSSGAATAVRPEPAPPRTSAAHLDDPAGFDRLRRTGGADLGVALTALGRRRDELKLAEAEFAAWLDAHDERSRRVTLGATVGAGLAGAAVMAVAGTRMAAAPALALLVVCTLAVVAAGLGVAAARRLPRVCRGAGLARRPDGPALARYGARIGGAALLALTAANVAAGAL